MFGETPRPYDMQNHIYDRNTGYTHEYIRQLRKVIEEYDDRALLGEIMIQGKGQMEQSASYTGKDNDELQLCFEFSMVKQRINARNLRAVAGKWYELCSLSKGKTPCWVLSNHDVPRAITRAGNNEETARMLAVYLLIQRGSSVIYFGEELGMQSKSFPRKELQDPLGIQYWPFFKGRDAERRPMQWDFSENMGFSTAKPWLEPNYTRDWRHLTVQGQESDSDSMLSLYRNLIKLRKQRSEISQSDAVFCDAVPSGVLSYRFVNAGRCTAVVLNMSRRQHEIRVSDVAPGADGLKVALSTHSRVKAYVKDGIMTLPPGLGVVLTN
jgi:alpha-glucosidase